MKVNSCRRTLAAMSLVMFLGFSPFDWWTLITNYLFSQNGTVIEQTAPQNDGSKDGTPVAQPSSGEATGGQCPMCPGPGPRPRPIPPGT